MAAITTKIANFSTLYTTIENAIINDEALTSKQTDAKLRKHYATFTAEALATKIRFGAIKLGDWWYPVINGNISRNNSHQLSSTAISEATLFAQANGLTVKGSQHITQ